VVLCANRAEEPRTLIIALSGSCKAPDNGLALLIVGTIELINGELINGQLINGQLINGQLINGLSSTRVLV